MKKKAKKTIMDKNTAELTVLLAEKKQVMLRATLTQREDKDKNTVKKLKREIARIQTILTEKKQNVIT